MLEIKGQVSKALCYTETIDDEVIIQIQKMCDQEFTRGSQICIMGVRKGCQPRFDLQSLKCYRSIRDSKKMVRSLGTLGGGTHFIEIDQGTDSTCYLVIYTGSGNLGKKVAEYYQKLAVDLRRGKEDCFKKKDALIAEYKAAGRSNELESGQSLRWTRRSCVTCIAAILKIISIT